IMMGDLNGKDKYKVPYDHKNAKVKSVDGITDDGELILTFTNDQGEVFKDRKGDPIQIPVPTSVVLDRLMLTNEDAVKQLVEGDELKVVTAHLDAQKTGSEPSAITLPPEDTLKNLEEMYSVTKVDEELHDMIAEKTPTQR